MKSKKVIISAVLWSAFDIFMGQGIQFVVVVILARILTPEDFGLIAMLAFFVGLAGVFIDSGFSSALIQRQNTTRADESSVFFFNLAMAAVAALVLCAGAPWIAGYFKKPVLYYLTNVMALNLVLSALGSIHITLLNKELNFKTIAKIRGLASFASAALAIILASQGAGVWSLAAQSLAASLITVALLWAWHPWRPERMFSFTALRSFFRFGGYLMAANIVDVLQANIYSFLIGRNYSVRDVGFYDRAQRTHLLPGNIIMNVIERVTFPVFSAATHDKEKLARGFRKTEQMVMFINIPLLIGVMVLARPLVLTLYGEKWLPSVPILQILGVVGLMRPLHSINQSVIRAQGRSDLLFKLEIIRKTVIMAMIVFASFYGILAIAWTHAAAAVFSLPVNAYYNRVMLNYGARKQVADLLPLFAAAAFAGFASWLVLAVTSLPSYVELIVAALTGLVVYLLTCRVLRVYILSEAVDLLRRDLSRTG